MGSEYALFWGLLVDEIDVLIMVKDVLGNGFNDVIRDFDAFRSGLRYFSLEVLDVHNLNDRAL